VNTNAFQKDPPSLALTFVTGPAGSGKTVFARELATTTGAALISKDALTRTLVEELLANAGEDRNDRESNFYVSVCRPLEYVTLQRAARDVLSGYVSVVVDAPYGQELSSSQWWEEQRAWCDQENIVLRVVCVEVALGTARERIAVRNSARDGHKLTHWDAYVHSLPKRAGGLPVIIVNNDASVDVLTSKAWDLAWEMLPEM
jgi:predicted kinase